MSAMYISTSASVVIINPMHSWYHTVWG